jgi:hypothetical protein
MSIKPWVNDLRVLELATRRYPHIPASAAFLFFMSDRRKAGPGALRQFSRGRGEVQCTKYRPLDGSVPFIQYTRRIVRDARAVYPPFDWSIPIGDAPDHVTLIQEPAVNRIHATRIDPRMFQTEIGRKAVARQLRELRKAK